MAGNFFFFLSFFKYYICVWPRRNIFIRGGKIFFIGLFCKFNFWKYRIFFLSLFFFCIISPSFILNFEFWNREDSFLFFFYIIIYMYV